MLTLSSQNTKSVISVTKSSNSFYTNKELLDIGFKSIGSNVLISRKTSIYSAENISIGDNVRVDDFTILSAVGGSIQINNHIHIAAFCNLIGRGGIIMEDYSGLSSRVSLYSATDDFSGNYLIGPVIDEHCTNVVTGLILLGKYSQIGTNSSIFPNVLLGEGSILGAHSFTKYDIKSWEIHVGSPARFISKRKTDLLRFIPIIEEK
jgi:dTDP-4-amino-4,6-dideoxy-D-glucose acyltransferase